jgi:DNA processing protein
MRKFHTKSTFLNHSDLHYKIALSFLVGIGPRKAARLLSTLGSAEAIFLESLKTIHAKTGIPKDLLRGINRDAALAHAAHHVNYIQKHNIASYFYLDAEYPRRLKQCSDAPILLFGRGKNDVNAPRMVSIVGTRTASPYGTGLCESFLQHIIGKEITVVSGMAYGIDICAHQFCVRNNIPTIGVLGNGPERIYPFVHQRTAEQMMERGGILTEFLPGTKPDRENFPMRNRIVAGMTDATIVIESKKSGGSLITAELANDYNKDVFAFPGNVGQALSEGCNQLIRQQKAHLITSADDFLTFMNWNDSPKNDIQRSCFNELDAHERAICELLISPNGEHIDVLSAHTGQAISALNVRLFHLEMKGIIKPLPGSRYRLI